MFLCELLLEILLNRLRIVSVHIVGSLFDVLLEPLLELPSDFLPSLLPVPLSSLLNELLFNLSLESPARFVPGLEPVFKILLASSRELLLLFHG